MNEDQTSSDYKLDKNGRKYPAKRIKIGASDIQEASYKGNIGIMELAKFHREANPEDKKKFISLMKKKSIVKSDSEKNKIANQIWQLIQDVTGTKLYQMETNLSFKDFYFDGLELQEQEQTDIIEYSKENLIEAWETKKFNKLVHGYLKHKRASKIGGFKAMGFKDYANTVEKVLKHPRTSKGTMSEQNVIVPLPKPGDPNHVILRAKKSVAGKHKDKKRESKRGVEKHKRADADFL